MPSRIDFWIRWRVRIGYPVALVYFVLAHPTTRWIVFGAIVGVFGLAIRAWAAGILRKHESLATSGPYAFTRNPLYFGSVVLAAGFIVAGHSLWAGTIVVAYLLVFYSVVMKREERELRAQYGSEFDEYASRVPLFWPRLLPRAPVGKPVTHFSAHLYRRNREYQAFVGFVLGLALLWAKMRWIG